MMAEKAAFKNRIEALFSNEETLQPEPGEAAKRPNGPGERSTGSQLATPADQAEHYPALQSKGNGRQLLDELSLINEVGGLIAGTHDLQQLLDRVAQLGQERLRVDLVQIYLVDEQGQRLDLTARQGTVGGAVMSRSRLPLDAVTLVGRAAVEGRTLLWEAVLADRLGLPRPALRESLSEMAVPMSVLGRTVGVIDLHSAAAGAIRDTQKLACEALAAQLASAVENYRLAGEVKRARSEVDALAGRMSRSDWDAFLDAIDRSERLGYSYDLNQVIPLDEPLDPCSTPDCLTQPLETSGEPFGVLRLDRGAGENGSGPAWSPDEAQLIEQVARQVAQHVENLRLVSEAGRFRQEAEKAAQRLTRQGWEEFLDAIERSERLGFTYDHQQVQPADDVALKNSAASNGHAGEALEQLIKISGEPVGMFLVEDQNSGWTPEQVNLVGSVAERVAQQVENLRLLAQAEKYRREAEEAAGRVTLEAWETYGESTPSLPPGFVYDQSRVVPITADAARSTGEAVQYAEAIRVREQAIGELAVELDERQDGETGQLLQAVAERLGSHIESLRLLDETERSRQQLDKRAAELETVAQVSTAAASILAPEELLQSVVDLTKSSFSLYHVGVFVVDEERNSLRMAAGAGEVGRKMLENEVHIPIERELSIIASSARLQEGVIVADVLDGESVYWPHPLLPETRSELAVPMIVGRRMLGVFDVQSDIPNRFRPDDLQTFATLARQVAVALQNAELYAEQQVTVERLRELDHLKSAFLANMSHELRTPLNSILGFTQVIMEGIDGPLTENMSMDLELIEKNGKHLLNLINEVLDMAKIEAGRMSLHKEPLDLRELLQDVVESTAPLAREKSLFLRLESGQVMHRPLIVQGDQVRLRQILLNLLGNAIKFTDNGGISVEVDEVRLRSDGPVLQVRIRDTGIGIPPSKLESIFEAFSQVDTSTVRKVGGTGLGLPISRRLVELHGGRLWAESSGIPGVGSVLYLELPLLSTKPLESTESV